MSVPVANFFYKADLLTVNFFDKSKNNPTSFSWVFNPDGTPNLSNVQNPSNITFTTGGLKTAKLTVTNVDGSNTITLNLIVSNNPILNLTILDMIKCIIPANLELDELCTDNTIKKWQLYLQPLVDPQIDNVDVLNEVKWPSLVNELISELVAYDLILGAFRQSTLSEGSSQTQGGSGGRILKKIVTGPAEAEWFNPSEFWSKVFAEGGRFNDLKISICAKASRLRIKLALCDKLIHDPIAFIKIKTPELLPNISPFKVPSQG